MKLTPNASTDVRRSRDMLIAAVACAAGIAVFTVATRPTTLATNAAPGPVARPHQRAGVTCDSCHSHEDARTSCTGCHDANAHTSTRPGHTRMRAEGTLGCTDCHRAHGAGQMVTLESTGAFIRSGDGVEAPGQLGHGAPAATVPLVPLSVCSRCHDLTSRTDPIALCTAGTGDPSKRPSLCMDEHKRAGDTHRFAAWDAAREVARTTAWVDAKHEDAQPWGLFAAGLASTSAALVFRRRRRETQANDAPLAPPPVKRLPVIDTSTCLGCHACVDACPFDVLEVEKFVAVVARPDDCCGVVLCQKACPNGSLRITDALTSPPRLVDDNLECVDVPGMFLAGDLTGLPLIKNALRQGAAAVDRVEKGSGDALDVVIVGAGPAGLAASLRAKERGLRYATLEQATLASSIQAFPRHKLVYDQPLDIPCEGELWMRECTKEELVMRWTRVARKHALAIREHHRVSGIAKEGDVFVVRAEHENAEVVLRTRRVIVATGRRGSPRKLDIDIAPGSESKIFYHLADARSLAGERVLVVGLGDAAMEAAIALASQPGTRVTMIHRNADFTRGKARNVGEIRSLVTRKKLDLRLATELVSVTPKRATLKDKTGSSALEVDAVFVLIGGKPSWELLAGAGVQIVSEDGSYSRG